MHDYMFTLSEQFLIRACMIGVFPSLIPPIYVSYLMDHWSRLRKCRLIDYVWYWSLTWIWPISLFLVYRPVQLLGDAIIIGGYEPNTCDENSYAMYPEDGGWACFPSELNTWLAGVAGPDGWKYLSHPGNRLLLCLLFSAIQILLFACTIHALCYGRLLVRDWPNEPKQTERDRLEAMMEAGMEKCHDEMGSEAGRLLV